MKNLSKIAGIALLSLTTSTWVSAQEKDNKGKNPDSVRPIDESNIMWKQRLWRRMDLKEKQNQPFFSKGNEITKYLMEWVQSGVLQPYKNDSLKTKITKEDFLKNLVMENIGNENALSDAEKAAGFGTESAGGTTAGSDDGWGDPKPKTPATGTTGGTTPPKNDGFSNPVPVGTDLNNLYYAKQLSILELREDAIFDKQRSRLYYDIQSITIIIPANMTTAGFDRNVGSFRYKDLDKLFRSNPNCVWYNEQNEAQHKNMADAFDLRLFHARLTKKGNSKDDDLDTIYGGSKQGLVQSQQLEYKLMEMEHNLWEY